MNINNIVNSLKFKLGNLPKIESVSDIMIKDRMIISMLLCHKSLGRLMVQCLEAKDSLVLFDFYFRGLSEKSRVFFPPYPLFNPPPISGDELLQRINEWKNEDDWTFLKLNKDSIIIGVCLLKRFKTKRPVSGLAVRDNFQKMGLGCLLQTIVNEQARLLNLNRLYVTLAQDNIASLKLHKKCGFKQTGEFVPHFCYKNGVKEVDREDIEMILDLI